MTSPTPEQIATLRARLAELEEEKHALFDVTEKAAVAGEKMAGEIEELRSRLAAARAERDTLRREVEGMRAALASAHAAGEEKGRREMREEAVRVAVGVSHDTGPGTIALLIRALPTTPPTTNPLPATGGESDAAEVDRG